MTSDKSEILKLQKKNESLNKDFCKLRSLYDQLLSEAPKESNDPRRLMLLKSQVFMLERQCHNMTLQLNQRQVSLQHASTTLENITLEMENWLVDSSKSTVIIKRTELENVIKTVRGVGKKFNKPSESFESVLEKQAIENKFSETDSSTQGIFNYNKKQISNLEHKLSELMVSMEKFKCTVSEKHHHKSKSASEEVSNSMRDFTTTNQDFEQNHSELASRLNDCCYDITLLSLLQPQLLNKKRKLSEEVTLESVLEFLRKHTRKKEVFEVIPIMWQIANHRAKHFKMKNIMMDNELQNCHQRLELHTKFVLDILSGLTSMFLEFETNTLVPQLSDPLSSAIEAYNLLQNEQTNENFTAFFKKFDSLLPNLERSVNLLKNTMKMENSSELQKMFRNELFCFTKNCLAERKRNENDIIDQEKENRDRKEKLAAILIGKDSKS